MVVQLPKRVENIVAKEEIGRFQKSSSSADVSESVYMRERVKDAELYRWKPIFWNVGSKCWKAVNWKSWKCTQFGLLGMYNPVKMKQTRSIIRCLLYGIIKLVLWFYPRNMILKFHDNFLLNSSNVCLWSSAPPESIMGHNSSR